MPSLLLESATDSLDLESVAKLGYGVQSLAGVSGLGLPPVATQWLEGAGDGAAFRGSRTLARDIDIPLLVQGRSRDELKTLMTRLSVMLSGPITLTWTGDERGDDWTCQVVRVGGGDYVFGPDTTGNLDAHLVVTLRAGDPYFTSTAQSLVTVTAGTGRGLLNGSLVKMKVAKGQAIGTITLNNTGDARAYPLWTIYGPGTDFFAKSVTGEFFRWRGVLAAGKTLTVSTKAGTIVDSDGIDRYNELDAMPRFWSVPNGQTKATAFLDGIVANQSRIECRWRARKWLAI